MNDPIVNAAVRQGDWRKASEAIGQAEARRHREAAAVRADVARKLRAFDQPRRPSPQLMAAAVRAVRDFDAIAVRDADVSGTPRREAWVRTQLRNRYRYIRERVAPMLGIDGDSALRALWPGCPAWLADGGPDAA